MSPAVPRRAPACAGRAAVVALAMLAAACAPARADGLDADSARFAGEADIAAWWARPGSPGWIPGAEQGGGFPWVAAGHAIGGWTLEEPLRASMRAPWPGAGGAMAPLAWTQRLTARWLGDGAWSGPGAGLVRLADSIAAWVPGSPARSSLFSIARGSSAEERNALRLVQRDSARTFVGEVAEWKRGGTGEWRDAGAHLYGLGFTVPWRAGRLEAAFGQRGSAGSVTSGEEESVTAYGGFARLLAPVAGGEALLELGRDLDHRDSFGGVLAFGRRDAQRTRAEAAWSRPHAGGTSGARVRVARSEVVQDVPFVARAEWEDDELWVAGRHRRPFGAGALEATLGGGHSSACGALGPAPAVAWEGSVRGAALRLAAGRAVAPVWSDLESGLEPFVQSTWSAGADLGLGAPGRRAWLGGRAGTTEDRAIVPRLPVAAWGQRAGVRRDRESWGFALGTAGFEWSGAPGGVDGEAYAMARDASREQPSVDPALGARAGIEGRRRFFRDDLDVRLRGEVAYVGERESEAAAPRRLAGYATFGAALTLVIADVTMVVDVRGLEDERRPEVWIHPVTGVEALGPGREFRVLLSWRLFD